MHGLGKMGVMAIVAVAGCARAAKPESAPKAPTHAKQELAPIQQVNTWLDGFHVLKDDPDRSFEAHHFCAVVNPDLTQCTLYDQNTPGGRLVGVEYVISERAFDALPDIEKRFWHPHNYEVLAGQLVAPGLSAAQDQQVVGSLLNTYGKTWHTWDVGGGGYKPDPLPMGEPELAWSFNADNEAPGDLVLGRDKRMGLSQIELIRRRQNLVSQAHPQEGVNALASHFPMRRPFPGVQEKTAATRSRPATK